jgi:hypothetical protein
VLGGPKSARELCSFSRQQASAKRELAASITKLIGLLSLGEDRALFRRHAADLETDAVLLMAQADRWVAALTAIPRVRTVRERHESPARHTR